MLEIQGGNLAKGVIELQGSKNASLALLAAALLTNKTTLRNVPKISDVDNFLKILKYLNVKVSRNENIINIDTSLLVNKSLDIKLFSKLRASYYLIGALLARFGKVKYGKVGGCEFSKRPINFHLQGFKKLGYEIKGNVIFKKREVKGVYFKLEKVSFGAAINLILEHSLSENYLIIDNAPLDLEFKNFLEFMNLVGVKCEYLKDRLLLIKGKKKLNDKIDFKVMYDKVAAFSYITLGAFIGDNLRINNFIIQDNYEIINLLNKLNVPFKLLKDSIIINRASFLNSLNITLDNYPKISSDYGPFICLLLTKTTSSILKDNIYPKRNKYVYELRKLNYNIEVKNGLLINETKEVKGGRVKCMDLRGGMALLISLLTQNSISYLENEHYLSRGYENYLKLLKNLNLNVKKI